MVTIATLQSQVRCFNLWNGTTNNAAPSGWHDLAFDDSAWPLSANPVIGNDFGGSPVRVTRVPPHQFYQPLAALPAGVEAIWPTATPLNSQQVSLFRWHFTMPAVLTSTLLEVFMPGTAIDYAAWINGVNVGNFDVAGGDVGFGGFLGNFFGLPPFQTADNVIALIIDNSHFDGSAPGLPSHIWDTSAWFAFRFTMDASAGRGFAQVIG